MSYIFSMNYLNSDGSPITTLMGAAGTVRATDMSSGEQFDFFDLTWKEIATTRTTPLTEDPNTPGRFIASFDYSSWGERRVEFVGVMTAPGLSPQVTEKSESFMGGAIQEIPFIPPVEGQYVSVADVRAFGISTDIVASDADVSRLIAHACQQIDFFTGQWFDKRTRTMEFRNLVGKEVFLPLLLVTLNSITLNDTVIPSDYIDTIYQRIPDDREDPRMYLLIDLTAKDILKIDGVWGCVDNVMGATPEAVKRAALLTIAELLGFETYSLLGSDSTLQQFITSESTDRHRYTISPQAIKAAIGNVATVLPLSARTLLAPFMAPQRL
jgi:hypothetical protein